MLHLLNTWCIWCICRLIHTRIRCRRSPEFVPIVRYDPFGACQLGYPLGVKGGDGGHREPISGYGLIGDTRTAALSSTQGSIDWLCLPGFWGDPIFGRLVGGDDA